ncbi:MAG: outer membrane lipoprotein-sorting protein [Nitrospirae bacterium]|nr:outer membrane lipoprotein-sorting protein [Nitrospirota bacterium]
MRRMRALLAGMLVAGLWASPATAAEPSPRDIMEKNFYVTKIKHLVNDSTMTLINDKGQQRVRKTHSVNLLQPNGIDSKIMIRFLFPGDVEGTGYLQVQHYDGDDDMWIYLPALKKVRRLVANNKKDSFVGSDFSYGDVLQPVVDTYKHAILKSEPLDGEACWVIESVPASEQIKKDYGYAKKTSWIRKSNFMEKKVEYLDTGGRPLKTMVAPEVVEVDPANHKWWAMRREVKNHQTGHSTLLVFEGLDTKQPVREDFFTTRYLEREK